MQQNKKRLATAGLFVCGRPRFDTLFPILAALLALLFAQTAPAQAEEQTEKQAAAATPINAAFLVAHPRIVDPNFHETVVLITQPDEAGGPMGVIINKPVKPTLAEAVPDLGKVPPQYNRLYRGGPVVPARISFLMRTRQAPEHSLHVLPDVYLTGDADVLESVLKGETKVTGFRAFAGLSSWAPGQLQGEILRGDWYLVKADVNLLFAEDASSLWEGLIERFNVVKTRGD